MSTARFEEKTYQTDSLDFGLWKRIFALMKDQKKRLIALGILDVLIAVFDVLLPYLEKVAIDTFASGDGSPAALKTFGIIFVCGGVMQTVCIFFYFMQAGHMEMDFSYNLRMKLFERLMTLSYSFFDVTPAGWLLSRVTSDIGRLAEILAWSLMDLFWGLTVMLGAVAVMLSVNWKLALLVIAVVPPLYLLSKWFNIHILKNYRDVRRMNSRITGDFSEGIAGAETAKTLALEDLNTRDFRKDTEEMRGAAVHAATLSSLFYPTVMMASAFSTAAILYYGGNQVLLRTIQFGTLVMFTGYAQQFFEPLNQISSLIAELQMAQASAERILSLLSEEPAVSDGDAIVNKYGTELNPKAETYEPIRGDVDFDHVSFHYGTGQEVLHDFSLHVNAGETVALVGETGSGKSTIVNLLCRFYEPTSGCVRIDGIDERERSLNWLHSRLGYVLQQPQLFSGTIRENIRFGRLDASAAEIEEACRLVHADSFIANLEKGLDTEVGENGNRLSTGQKQLISFARALIADPRIFVLDEATASVDTATEQLLQESIQTVMNGRTSFVVAHRLSTIVNADKILVMHHGKVVEQGTHAQLLARGGYYYQLYTNQFSREQNDRIMGKSEARSE